MFDDFDAGVAGEGACRACRPALTAFSLVLDVRGAAVFPFAQGFADNFISGGVVAGGDGLLGEFGAFRGEGDAEFGRFWGRGRDDWRVVWLGSRPRMA
jgi:hypothetical protein